MEQILYYFFNWTLISPYLPEILQGFWVTLQMAVMTVVLGTALGLALAVLRCYGWRPVNILMTLYVDVFRAIPQLVIIVLVFFALPSVGIVIDPMPATVLALSLVLSAFAEEIFWSGIAAVPTGQWEAGRSTGMGFSQTLFAIILPQAVRLAIPPLTNRAIGITKGTTLGSVIAVPELLNVSSNIQSTIANPTAFTAGAFLFCLIFFPFVYLTRVLERRYAIKS
ncbi:amino acid ABC transporter permease [Alcaligenes ammonioxydans]|jgi:cystine transport system permease protein|uniref:Amino acid ABC transporter permease n=1 Tax=Alcaligenes ammonioxydans TaxID=2582914 RepID=A0ABX8SRV1_9BURK|nr:amino acid ABC transporter permease [Alcaligenes ammonioxydans]EJC62106.1 polar amino acid ABC transporter inner membrane subunit [Alcaligenes faecalis subsp. faecalis NCIB 8687]QBH19828.1 amino acid ABC transporter permease [Alcaligenes faecalis]MCH1878994.1 amino acid ABC transporter permease [Alcaligenes ammonioxydans]QXX77832.1 amino acid ABC transporter permease [Alcaligenes ammonioxydans]WGQ35888.1 amino acid ABC transporter permease [Alcaligenes faecalis]